MRHGYHNLTNYRMLHIAKDSPFFEEYAQAKILSLFLAKSLRIGRVSLIQPGGIYFPQR